MDHAARQRARLCLAGLVLVAAAIGSGDARAQSPLALLRDEDGAVACIVSRLPMASVVADPPGSVDIDRLVIEIRAPGAPAAASVSKLPARLRDFSKLPIEVYLLPSAGDSKAISGKPLRVDAQLVDATLIRGVANTHVYARVTYPRGMLRPGVQIVAQRTAQDDDGEKVISQTRCRIRGEDAANWR